MSVKLTHVQGRVWRATSASPEELAEAENVLRGTKPDPDRYQKNPDGIFSFEGTFLQLDPTHFPWREMALDGFNARRP